MLARRSSRPISPSTRRISHAGIADRQGRPDCRARTAENWVSRTGTGATALNGPLRPGRAIKKAVVSMRLARSNALRLADHRSPVLLACQGLED